MAGRDSAGRGSGSGRAGSGAGRTSSRGSGFGRVSGSGQGSGQGSGRGGSSSQRTAGRSGSAGQGSARDTSRAGLGSGGASRGRNSRTGDRVNPGPSSRPGPAPRSSSFGPPPRGRRGAASAAGLSGPSRSSERGLGGDLVEGRQAVRELLLAGRRRVRDVWMADGTDESPILGEIEQLASEARVTIHRVSREQLLREARTETPQGVLAHAEELREVEFDELMVRRNGRNPFLLAVDSVTDPQNLGALLRSADGAGVTGVLLPKHRTVHVTPTVTKAAAGAIERIPMALVGGLPSALLRAKEKFEAWVLGLDADGPVSLYELSALGDAPLIVVVGAEGAGLSRLVRDRCDELVSIPLRGSLSSLNASVAGAVAMFELGRHR